MVRTNWSNNLGPKEKQLRTMTGEKVSQLYKAYSIVTAEFQTQRCLATIAK